MISRAIPTGLRATLYAILPKNTIGRSQVAWNSTLSSNPRIKILQSRPAPSLYVLTYLKTEPPCPNFAIGSSTTNPPTPRTFNENPLFLSILNEVLVENAHNDPGLKSQAKVFAGPGGTSFSTGAAPAQPTQYEQTGSSKLMGDGGAGGASAQGGAGGGHHGGFIHLSDERNPPDFGRIAWPEDILGSVEVDSAGDIVGRFQPSGTYRVLTNEGVLGLSSFLTEKLVARLEQEERLAGSSSKDTD